MKLERLIENIQIKNLAGDSRCDIAGVNIDSRRIEPGHLFIALRGTQADGHAYIGKAIDRGAVAVLCETLPETLAEGVTYVQVANTEDVVGHVATTFYGNPTSRLKLVGVTGTNGKTTIATLLYNMFRHFGYKVGLLSTVCNYIDGEAVPTDHTTPDPVTLNALLGRMADAGCEYAFMEVSSHATFDNYLKAKKAFFDGLPKTAFALTNADDRNGSVMVQNTRAGRVAAYSLRSLCDFQGRVLEDGFDGMLMDINGTEVNVQFIGRFNASNLLAVYGAAVLLGQEPHDVLVALSLLRPVAGRFDAMRSPDGYTAIVDYAHTPDALENVLNAIHEVLRGRGHVITVVGAGGNRDKGKRPLMAHEAARQSDRVVITSDNPRFEEPQDIINDMLAGLTDEDKKKTLTIVDRREAIRTACMLAQAGDVVLVAGKGHEDYQEIKGVKHHFDDREVIRELFAN